MTESLRQVDTGSYFAFQRLMRFLSFMASHDGSLQCIIVRLYQLMVLCKFPLPHIIPACLMFIQYSVLRSIKAAFRALPLRSCLPNPNASEFIRTLT